MKTLEIKPGIITQVDDEDYDRLNQFKWHQVRKSKVISRCYYDKQAKRPKGELMHRFIMKARSEDMVDHADGDPTNNQKSNLRFCVRLENNRNRKKNTKCAFGKLPSSQYKGVFLSTNKTKWRAVFTIKGQRINLGQYQTEKEAALAYNGATNIFFGEFARPNKV